MNPANNMPYLPNRRLNENEEKLSTEREISSIPMSVEGNNGNINRWEYPSPQQFYNALLRKGMETPVEHIDTMVDIHNFLNEGAWNEVLKWEKLSNCDCSDPKLLRFSGRPKEMSPKAWFYTTFFGAPKPFDRHDWIVDRCGKEVRYVIDYYAGDENPHEDAPEFVLDVRPAIDSLGAIKSRLAVAFTEFFQRFNNSS
ncbi:cytochrome c and c1 heme-lyase [Neoconidiobolus thromboides FSU 785]|nr:cytochrome c and c1 heme-lyase [Neoconidiobolus thromboides FSU 785]